VAFATKPELAEKMIGRAVKAGVPFSWVAGDEVYGGNPGLRSWLEEEGIAYVMAVACSEMITAPAGRFRADELAALVPPVRLAAAQLRRRVQGPRLYDWAVHRHCQPRSTSCWPAAPFTQARRASWR